MTTVLEVDHSVELLREEKLPDCPYRGLEPFDEEDQTYFFGREDQQEVIGSNLITAPLTIFYGPSGVGKTSVLRAGVVPFIRRQPDVLVVLFRAWQAPDFEDALKRQIAGQAGDKQGAIDTKQPLDLVLAQVCRVMRSTVVVILDQFEEYALYHPATTERGTAFDAALARAVNRTDIDANFLISIREDSLARLDRFSAYIPDLLGNRVRLDHLDSERARRAIEKPLERYNAVLAAKGQSEQAVDIEPSLVDRLLDGVRADRVTIDSQGKGQPTAPGLARSDRIETPFLQMVLMKLWKTERAANSRTLRLATLDRLGGPEEIVASHVGAVMSALTATEQRAAANIFDRLITPSGAKVALSEQDLVGFAGGSNARVSDLIVKLTGVDARILRGVTSTDSLSTRYEIYHDVLSHALLDWRIRFLEKEKSSKRVKAIILYTAAAVLVAGIIGAFWYRESRKELKNVQERQHLLEQQRALQEQMNQMQASLAVTQSKYSSSLRQSGALSQRADLLEESLKIARDLNDKNGEYLALSALGDVYFQQRNYVNAGNYYRQALAMVDKPTDRAVLLAKQARIARQTGDTKTALDLYGQAISLQQQSRNAAGQADALADVGDLYRAIGNNGGAVKAFASAAQLYASIRNPARQADMMSEEALTDQNAGRLEQALTLWRDVAAIRRAQKDTDGEAKALAAVSAIVKQLTPVVVTTTPPKSELPCTAESLSGIWQQIDPRSVQQNQYRWNFYVTTDSAGIALSVERADKFVTGAFVLKGRQFIGNLRWASGDEWDNVILSPPPGATNCDLLQTNRSWAYRRIGMSAK